jgi:hypothetical protein
MTGILRKRFFGPPTFSITTLKASIQKLACMASMSLMCASALGQGSTGRILGAVTDRSGGAVVGASVSVEDTARGVTRTLTTDSAGEYNAPNLIPGTYVVRAEAQGFKKIERQNILIQVGEEVRADLIVQPGDVDQTVTVNAATPLVESTNATLGGALSNADIGNMPLNGRNIENLLSLRPGVMMQPGGGPNTQSTNGTRPDESVWMIEGIINSNFYDARPNANTPGYTTDGATILPLDAIQEFNTMENPKAEYGWRPGAVVNIGLKSGTNKLNGSVYGFYRSAAWDARNYFNPASGTDGTCDLNPTSPADLQAIACGKLPTQLRQYGAVLSGPIMKNKLFFMGGYEALNSLIGNAFPSSGIPQTVAQPTFSPGYSMVDAITAAQRGGALSLCSTSVYSNCLSPASLAIGGCSGSPSSIGSYTCTGGLFPNNPTTPSNPGPTSYISNFPNTNLSYNGVGKLDYHINDKNMLSGEVIVGNYHGTGEDHPFINKAFTADFILKTYTTSGTWDYILNSNVLNEVRFGYNRFDLITTGNDTGITIPDLTTGLTVPGVPNISIGSPSGFFAKLGTWHNRPQSIAPNPYYDFQESLSNLKGKHTLKIGVEYAHAEADSNVPDFGRGAITFSSLQNFFEGVPASGQARIGDAKRAETFTKVAGFAQDDWRIKPRLTLNLGLRYEYTTPWRDTQNLWANFDPNSPTGLIQQGQPGENSLWKADPKNFSPHLGVAWDVKGNGNTVVRGGFSIIYSTLSADVFMNQNQLQNGSDVDLAANPTGAGLYSNGSLRFPGAVGGISVVALKSTPTAQNWENVVFPNLVQCGDGMSGDPGPCNLMAVDPNLVTPRVMNVSLGVTQSFGANTALEVGYVGNLGSNLTGISDVNACAVSNPTSATYTCSRPYGSQFSWFGTIDKITNDTHSNFNSLQVTLTKRMSHGLSLLMGYTYGHGLDNGSLSRYGLLSQNPNNPGAEYGSSDFDIRHRLTVTSTYELPSIDGFGQLLKGWQVNSIVTLQGGQPWVVNDSENNWSGVGDTSDRWNFVGNPADFKSTRNSIPYCTFSATGDVTGCSYTIGQSGQSVTLPNTIAAPCLAAAGARGSLSSLEADGSAAVAGNVGGCYVSGNSVMIPPAFGAFGEMRRNIFRDSGFKNMDFSVLKNFAFSERYKAQFRFEVFNIFNHPNFANPWGASDGTSGGQNDPGSTNIFGGTPGTPDFNAGNPIVGAGGARDIQIGLKLSF